MTIVDFTRLRLNEAFKEQTEQTSQARMKINSQPTLFSSYLSPCPLSSIVQRQVRSRTKPQKGRLQDGETSCSLNRLFSINYIRHGSSMDRSTFSQAQQWWRDPSGRSRVSPPFPRSSLHCSPTFRLQPPTSPSTLSSHAYSRLEIYGKSN